MISGAHFVSTRGRPSWLACLIYNHRFVIVEAGVSQLSAVRGYVRLGQKNTRLVLRVDD
jgi:hypothetical protein